MFLFKRSSNIYLLLSHPCLFWKVSSSNFHMATYYHSWESFSPKVVCFRVALHWMHHSGLPKECLTFCNVYKGSIVYNCWAHSVSNIVARDVVFLIRLFNLLSIFCFQIISLPHFIFFFMMLLELCNIS